MNARLRASLAACILLFACPDARAAAGPATLVVTVVDQSGAAVPGATVTLHDAGVVRTRATTGDGTATFTTLPEGDVTIEVHASGFEVLADTHRLAAPITAWRVALTVARVQEAVTVTSEPEAGAAHLLTPADLVSLPDDPDELARVLTEMAGVDAALVINGFEGGRLPAKGQIASVRIVSDPFSAQYQDAGRARVEVTTRPGVGPWSGMGSIGQRPSAMAARNPFSPVRLPSARTSLYTWVSGPIVPQRSSITLDVQRARARESRPTLALLPSGATRFVVDQPDRSLWLTLRSEVFVSTRSLLRIEGQAVHADQGNTGLGDVDLPERGATSRERQHVLRLSIDTERPDTTRRELRLEVRDNRQRSWPITDAVAIDVQGAFRAGGAQRRGGRATTAVSVVAQWDVRRGHGRIRYGVQGDRVALASTEQVNYLGTYVFADLAAYLAGDPTTFSRRTGAASVDLHDTRVAAYAEWERPLSRAVAIAVGDRLSSQWPIGGGLRQSPRAMLRWAIDSRTLLRINTGRFLDWFDQGLREEASRLNGPLQQDFIVPHPGYPFAGEAAPAAQAAPGRVVIAPGIAVPAMWRTSARLERKLMSAAQVTVTAALMRGDHEARSTLRNAPVDGVRPDPLAGNIRFVDAVGRSRVASLEVNGRAATPGRRVEGHVSYTVARAMNDGDGAFAYPATGAGISGEWGRSRRDLPNRLIATVTAKAWQEWRLAAFLRHQSGSLYSITTGRDDNGDTISNDRPAGTPRNSARGPGWTRLDVRAARAFTLVERGSAPGADPRALKLELSVSAANVLNRPQYGPVVGVLTSPFFGRPTSARAPRSLEVGASLAF